MEKKPQNQESLRRFFLRWLTTAFSDVQIFDRNVVLYIAEVLTRFARSENLHRIKRFPTLRPMTVVEMLIEAETRSRPSEPEFDPFGERDIRKHLADYALFMTGIFREYIEKLGILDLYFREGSESYQKVYEFDAVLAQPTAELFHQLGDRFEVYSGGINYMRKVYFDNKMPVGIPPHILRSIFLD